MQLSSTENQFKAYCQSAESCWLKAELLESAYNEKRLAVSSMQRAVTWDEGTKRKALEVELRFAQRTLDGLGRDLKKAWVEALKAVERATALKWGVKFGHTYEVCREGQQGMDCLTIDYIKPVFNPAGQFICFGSMQGVTYMMVLGRDVLTFTPKDPSNLVSLQLFSVAGKSTASSRRSLFLNKK